MNMLETSGTFFDTIYALSSGVGKAAIAIVRVSGPSCSVILERLCPGAIFKDREAKLVLLRDQEQIALDRAVVIRFFAPHSYTGEEMIEFQVTGSRAVLSGLFQLLALCPNTRPAEAGEFTRRAFENGKIDLVEIEGLASVLAAETSAQLRHAMGMASGGLSRRCERVRELVLKAICYVESSLDFSDVDDAASYSLEQVMPLLRDAKSILTGMLDHSGVSERLRDGMVVVIAGPPNVGKSTLLNYLAKRDVAIVSPIPGTTRDNLEVVAEIRGFPVTFVDTAGIRETSDPLEKQGIGRSLERTANADLVLWLFDGESPSCPPEVLDRPVQRVRTKADLSDVALLASDVISISTKAETGIHELLSAIGEFAKEHFEGSGSVIVGTERQRAAVRGALEAIDRICVERDLPGEVVAEELRVSARSLSRITGRIEVEEVLAEVFSQLCVGK
jgi:tRNA modification GTPase